MQSSSRGTSRRAAPQLHFRAFDSKYVAIQSILSSSCSAAHKMPLSSRLRRTLAALKFRGPRTFAGQRACSTSELDSTSACRLRYEGLSHAPRRASWTQLLAPGAADDVRIVEIDCSRRSPVQILDSQRTHRSIKDVRLRPYVAFRYSRGLPDSWVCHVRTFPCKAIVRRASWWTAPPFRRSNEGLRSGCHQETMLLACSLSSLNGRPPENGR